MQTNQPKIKLMFFITKGNFGGAQRYVFDLATNLSKKEYDISVICGAGIELPERLRKADIKIWQISNLNRNINPFSDIKATKEIYKIIKNEKPDVLHLNSSKAGIIGAIIGRLNKIKKIIFTGHGWYFNERRNIISKIITYKLHWLTVLLCHQTIAVSEKTARDIYKLPIKKNKIMVIKNGINDFETINKTEARKLLMKHSGLLQDLPINNLIWLGSIGELHENKGFETAVKTISKLTNHHPDLIYIIIGEGEERKNLEKLISKLELKETVFLLGNIPEARKLLKALDIFIIPSRTEALPYVALEAGLAGLPTVCSKVGGLPEIITDEKSGLLIRPNDEDELSQAIEKLLINKTLMTRYGLNLQETIRQDFTLDKMVSETAEIYKSH